MLEIDETKHRNHYEDNIADQVTAMMLLLAESRSQFKIKRLKEISYTAGENLTTYNVMLKFIFQYPFENRKKKKRKKMSITFITMRHTEFSAIKIMFALSHDHECAIHAIVETIKSSQRV